MTVIDTPVNDTNTNDVIIYGCIDDCGDCQYTEPDQACLLDPELALAMYPGPLSIWGDAEDYFFVTTASNDEPDAIEIADEFCDYGEAVQSGLILI